jgi:cephalosporin hydroxylase
MTWEDVPGWFSFRDVYERIAQWAPEKGHFVELGGALGRSSIFLASRLRELGKAIRIDVVDRWWDDGPTAGKPLIAPSVAQHGGFLAAFEHNVKACSVADMITPIQGSLGDISKRYQNDSLDLVFIDADHSYEGVMAAIGAYLPKVKRSGYIGGDDYSRLGWPGVVKAVDELLPAREIIGTAFLCLKD